MTPVPHRRCTPGTSRCSACSSGSWTRRGSPLSLGLAVAAILAVLGCLVAAHWWRQGEKVFAVALVGLTHLSGVAAVVDPSLRVDPADGDGGIVAGSTAMGSIRSADSG